MQGRDHGPFRFRDPGALATIGRKKAVVQFGRFRRSGYLAWWLWSIAHIYFLIGFRNRLVVAMNWAWTYVSFQRGSRLITGHDPEHSLLNSYSDESTAGPRSCLALFGCRGHGVHGLHPLSFDR